jgi:hypothetical protein
MTETVIATRIAFSDMLSPEIDFSFDAIKFAAIDQMPLHDRGKYAKPGCALLGTFASSGDHQVSRGVPLAFPIRRPRKPARNLLVDRHADTMCRKCIARPDVLPYSKLNLDARFAQE